MNKKLMKVAFLFGADIPFFVKGKQSYVGGCGEKVKPIKKEIERDIIIIIPTFNLSTREVFQNLDINGIKNRKNKKIIFPENIYNDMEESANALANNKIEEFKQKISKICDGRVLMSGSGSTLVYYVGVNEDKNIVYNKIKELLPECKVILSKLITE